MNHSERTPTLDGTHDAPEDTPTDLEEHSLFVLHPMWMDKGDLL